MFHFKWNLAKLVFCVNEPWVFLVDKNPLLINCFLVLNIITKITKNPLTMSVAFQNQQQTFRCSYAFEMIDYFSNSILKE